MTEEAQVEVYFGLGCFWHMQHEFVDAERDFLGRNDDEITSLAGYAGGSKTGQNANGPFVCYHNRKGLAVYGDLGHGEVVGMTIPESSFADFAGVYFGITDSHGDRPDKGDRGAEYRSLIGIPGGIDSPLY
jgi:peptide methionine sulfoxide reductase MsrA